MHPLMLTVFIDLVGFGIVLPLLPLYATAFGASPETVTLVAASYTLAQSAFGPFWGWMSDRVGRKPVLLVTIAGTAAAYLLLAFTSTLWMLFAARFVGGAMAANIGVAHALVADVTAPEDRTRAIARLGGAAGLGFVVGPAVGGLLAGGGEAPDFATPYLAAAAFSAAAFALALFLVRETVTAEQKTRARAAGGWRIWLAALGAGETRLILCLMFMPPFVFAGVEAILVLWSAAAWGWTPQDTGPFYAWMGFCYVVLQWAVVAPLARRVGERAMATAGAASLGLGVLWMPLAQAPAELYGAAFLMVLGVAANAAALNSLLSRQAGAEGRGRLLGLGQACAGAGRIAGPASAGVAFGQLGLDWPFVLGVAMMIVMALASRRLPADPPAGASGPGGPDRY